MSSALSKVEPALDIERDLPMDDAATFDLLKRCETTARVPARIARHEGL